MEQLGQAKILITNYHAFLPREKVAAGKLTKAILANGQSNGFTETPDQMVRRVCRELGNKKNIIVINDEAHHCYRRKPDGEDVKLTGDDRKEAEKRDEGGPRLDLRHRGGQSQDRREGHLRPFGHAVFPPRLRLAARPRSSPGSSPTSR